MGKILQFPVTEEARARLAENAEIKKRWREIENAIQRPGYILLAWELRHYVGGVIYAWYAPEDGGNWVYDFQYDAKSMQERGGASRSSSRRMYKSLMEDMLDPSNNLHVCAPLYILLDSKDLRKEYLAGRLEANA